IRLREPLISSPKNRPNREFWLICMAVQISKKTRKVQQILFTETEFSSEAFYPKKNTNILFLCRMTKATDTDITRLLKTINFSIKGIIKLVIRMKFLLLSDTLIMDSEPTDFMRLREIESREKL